MKGAGEWYRYEVGWDHREKPSGQLPGIELIPTSMTMAPGFTQSRLTIRGWREATTRMSASEDTCGRGQGRNRDSGESGL